MGEIIGNIWLYAQAAALGLIWLGAALAPALLFVGGLAMLFGASE